MLKLTYIAALVLSLVACGGGEDPIVDVPPIVDTRPIVELNGDSIMYGQGLAIRPAETLQQLLPNYKIVDKSVTGLTMDGLFKGYTTAWVGGPPPRFGPQPAFSLIERKAKYVVIALGGNDAYGNLPLNVFEAQLQGIINTIKAEGRIPVVTGIIPVTPISVSISPIMGPSPVFDMPTVIRTVQFNTSTNLIADLFKVPNAFWSTVEYTGLVDTIDGIHRTQEASDKLMVRLADTIKAIP